MVGSRTSTLSALNTKMNSRIEVERAQLASALVLLMLASLDFDSAVHFGIQGAQSGGSASDHVGREDCSTIEDGPDRSESGEKSHELTGIRRAIILRAFGECNPNNYPAKSIDCHRQAVPRWYHRFCRGTICRD